MNDKDKRIIDELKSYGFGWSKFAKSVEKQGWVSERQRDTMIAMLQKVRRMNKNSQQKDDYADDISDSEAMSFGEYF